MILYSKVSEAPDSEPVTPTEAKAWCKVDGTDEDTLITSLIKVARIMCETYAGLSFITQTREIKLDRFPGYCYSPRKNRSEIIIPYGPVSEEEFSITYLDSNGDEQTLTIEEDFYLDTHSDLARVWPVNSWPDTDPEVLNSVTITYTAGSEGAPEVAKQAILMTVATLFENRQNEVIGTTAHAIGYSAQMLLDTIKVYWNAEV